MGKDLGESVRKLSLKAPGSLAGSQHTVQIPQLQQELRAVTGFKTVWDLKSSTPDFRGNAFNFSPLRVMLAVGLSYIAFIMLRYVPSIHAFWRVLIINGC